MNGSGLISRRGFVGGVLLAWLGGKALAQGFAGLGESADGFAAVVPGRTFSFPADHGPHPEFRIEWWYVTANLADANGSAYGAQWTLFRQAIKAGPPQEGWANQQIWMGHAAVTRADTHRTSQTFARGGVGQAGAEAKPFLAWIDYWEMRGLDSMNATNIAPLELKRLGHRFQLCAAPRCGPAAGAAGRRRLQPEIAARAGLLLLQPAALSGERQHHHRRQDGRCHRTGLARPRMEQPAAGLGPKRMGLALAAFQERRKADAVPDAPDRRPALRLGQMDRARRQHRAARLRRHRYDAAGLSPRSTARKIPTSWRIAIPKFAVAIDCTPLNAKSWMGTSFPYWEGPISFAGSHAGVGYLEMTGY